jgi:UDP-glucose 4-epimerase
MDLHGKYTEVLIRWMQRIDAGLPPIILGDGRQTMDFVFIDDVARSNLLALISDVRDDVFNVASGTETSLNDLAAALLHVMRANMKPEYGPERAVNPVPRRLADTSKAQHMLGFKAQTTLEDGLARLVDWWHVNKTNMVAASFQSQNPIWERPRRKPRAVSFSADGPPKVPRWQLSRKNLLASLMLSMPAQFLIARQRCIWH